MLMKVKFRAWDKRFSMMIYQLANGYRHDFNGEIALINDRGESIAVSDEFELMQFIGLKDKNGEEIYEGDIVKCGWYYGDDFGNEIGDMEFSNQVVEFTVGAQGSGFDLNVHGMENSEIIGNIYENPELLESKK